MILAPLNKSRQRNFDRAEDFYIFKFKADLVGLTVIMFVISLSASRREQKPISLRYLLIRTSFMDNISTKNQNETEKNSWKRKPEQQHDIW